MSLKRDFIRIDKNHTHATMYPIKDIKTENKA